MNVAFDKGHRAALNLVNPAANPYPKYSAEAIQWHYGHQKGHDTRYLVQSREHELYRVSDPARYQLLWG